MSALEVFENMLNNGLNINQFGYGPKLLPEEKELLVSFVKWIDTPEGKTFKDGIRDN